MTTQEIIIKINEISVGSSDDFDSLEQIRELTGLLRMNNDGYLACEHLIYLLERHPDVEFGTPGEPVHTLEKFPGYYEAFLYQSLERQPTEMTVWMLNRIINAETDIEKENELLNKLKNCLNHPLASDLTKETTLDFLKRQTNYEDQPKVKKHGYFCWKSQNMKRFFHQTYYFWLITRVIFIAGGLLDSARMFDKGLDALDVLINTSILVYLGLMIYNTINEYRNALGSPITKYIVGALSIILAVAIIVIVVTHDSRMIVLAGIFAGWIALLGVFDLLVLNRSEEEYEEAEEE